MAQKLGIFDQWFRGEWADRDAINWNAQELSAVSDDIGRLNAVIQRQAGELLRLRALIMGVVEVLHDKAPFDNAELERAIQVAWAQLTMPAEQPHKAAQHDNRQVTCTRCGKVVPASRTNITERGEVCDACV
jgi:hypothetical protein